MPYDPSATRSGTTFSDNPTYAGAWIVYMNGIEVPSIGFEVDYGVWQIPSFRVHLVPDVLLQRLGNEDRIPVQIFYLDPWATEDPTFRLLVDGEIVGWSYSSATGQRSIAFSCLAHIHMFQQLYFFFMTNVDDIVASRDPVTVAKGFSTPGLLYPYGLFHTGLLSTSNQVEDVERTTVANRTPVDATAPIKAPYELVTNVIKGVISQLVPNERRAVPMMNFFARHTRKVRLHNRWVRLPILEDAETLDQRKGVFPIFAAARNEQALLAMQRQVASQVGSSGPVWNLYEQILKLVYMEIAMIPNPACVQVTLRDLAPGKPEEGRILRELTDNARLTTARRGVDAASVANTADGLYRAILAMIRGQTPINQAVLTEAGFTSLPRENEVILGEIVIKLLHAQNAEATANGDAENSYVDPMEPIRLAQYFVKPPFNFGEVPVCNVLLPSQIDNFTYDENFIQQPTRLYVNDAVMTRLLRAQGANRELMLHALTVGFPEEADALMHHKVASSGQPVQDVAAGGAESGRNLLIWPEELFKGPVTARGELPSWFQFMRQFANANKPDDENTAPATAPAPRTPAQVTTPADTRIPSSDLAPANQLVPPAAFTPYTAPAREEQQRRGRPFVRPQADPNWPYRWHPSEAARARGETQNVRYDGFPTYAQAGTTQSPRSQGIQRLAAHLRQLFPQIVGPSEFDRGSRLAAAAIARGATRQDGHQAGRAVDLTIRTVPQPRGGSLPNLEAGNPIADYLIQNAEAFGLQLLVWSRSQWKANPSRGQPHFSHYTNLATSTDENEAARMDHINHLHVEINGLGAALLTPFFQNGAPLPSTLRATQTIVTRPNPRVVTSPPEVALPGTATPGQNQPNRSPATPTTPAPSAAHTAATAHGSSSGEARGDAFSDLFRLYAQQEYLMKRYEKRNAAANLRFNPYLIPGFPAMMFDRPDQGFHLVGTIQTIRHTGFASSGAAGMSTQITLSYGRMLNEFVNDVRNDANRFAGRVTSAPAELIREIRVVIQDREQAEKFYGRLLYGVESRPGGFPTVFQWDKALGYARGLQIAPIEILGASVSEVEASQEVLEEALRVARAEGGDEATVEDPTPERLAVHSLDPNETFSPNPSTAYANAFDNRHIAMQLASRPVCTLEQYIRFWHGGKTVNALLRSEDVQDPILDFAYKKQAVRDVVDTNNDGTERRQMTERASAVYYARIFKLRTGPGPEPTAQERGFTSPPDVQPTSFTAGLPADYPQTRTNWDSVLIQYRQKIRFRLGSRT